MRNTEVFYYITDENNNYINIDGGALEICSKKWSEEFQTYVDAEVWLESNIWRNNGTEITFKINKAYRIVEGVEEGE